MLYNQQLSIVDIPINNERFCSLKFPVATSSMVHGFAGYFDTVLYNQITLSEYNAHVTLCCACTILYSISNIGIVPTSYSKGMFSWFPVFIPIKVSCSNDVHVNNSK